MSKTKGALSRATIEKQERAPARLEDCKTRRDALERERRQTESEIRQRQQRLQELRKQQTACRREIEELEKLVREKDAREKNAADMRRIQEQIDQLVENGVSAGGSHCEISRTLFFFR